MKKNEQFWRFSQFLMHILIKERVECAKIVNSTVNKKYFLIAWTLINLLSILDYKFFLSHQEGYSRNFLI